MRHTTLACLPLATLLVACQADAPAAPDALEPRLVAAQARGERTTRWEGRCATTFVVTGFDGPALSFTGMETATGGTGRLVGSTGRALVSGSANQASQQGGFVAAGQIVN